MGTDNNEKDLVFASYNRKDAEVVRAIGSTLQQRGIRLWIELQRLDPGAEWQAQLEFVISRANAAVVFKGPSGFGNWQLQEIYALFKRHVDEKVSLIPALLPGASGKDAGVFLGNLQHVDFRLRVPDPFDEMARSISGKATNPKAMPLQSARLTANSPHPLVQWLVNEMDNFGDIDRYGRLYVYAKRWPEALYIYYRLANLAISRSNRAYADSYLQIGRIYFLTDQPEEAEKKWEISRRIYQDSFRSELDQLERRVEAIRTSRAAYSPPG